MASPANFWHGLSVDIHLDQVALADGHEGEVSSFPMTLALYQEISAILQQIEAALDTAGETVCLSVLFSASEMDENEEAFAMALCEHLTAEIFWYMETTDLDGYGAFEMVM